VDGIVVLQDVGLGSVTPQGNGRKFVEEQEENFVCPQRCALGDVLLTFNFCRKILMYVTAMFAVRKALQFNKKGIDKEQLAQKMPGVPPVITDSLLGRYTEVPRGSAMYDILGRPLYCC